jgi:hypothetical protein
VHRVDQTDVGVGDHQGGAGQTAGDQTAQERQPAGAVLVGDDVEAEHLAVALGVDPDGDDDRDVDDAAALADLLGHGVERHVGVGAAVEGPVPERCHLGVQVGGHPGHLRLGQLLDPQGLHEPLDPAGRHAPYVALGHHRHQRPFGPPSRLEQPTRVVAALPDLGDGQIDRAHPCVELARPVTVAAVGPLRSDLTETGVAQHIHLGGHEPLGERAHHLTQQIAALRVEVLAQPIERVHVVGDHRVLLSGSSFAGLPEVDAVVVASGGPSPHQSWPVHHELGLKRPTTCRRGRRHGVLLPMTISTVDVLGSEIVDSRRRSERGETCRRAPTVNR